eukprot:Colp12_sorted_trinity150504_noHs@3685
MAPVFGQVVIGPPGSGKTTYCKGMKQYLEQLGRKVSVVNLDPANDFLTYECAVDLHELITLSDVMDKLDLGPNGGLVYCLEFLEKNFDWLKNKLAALDGHYILFDCPGQVELYTHHNSIRNILDKLQKLDYRLVSIHLVDAHYCADPAKFISVLLTSLSTMVQLNTPHINVLSKIDLLPRYGKLSFNLDFYTEVLDLSYLVEHLGDDAVVGRFKKLNAAMCEIIEGYSLVSFSTLDIQNRELVAKLVRSADKASGYLYGHLDATPESLLFANNQLEFEYDGAPSVQEQYMKRS